MSFKSICTEASVCEDGSLYFVLDETVGKKRFMECTVEYEDGEFVLRANDHIVVKF